MLGPLTRADFSRPGEETLRFGAPVPSRVVGGTNPPGDVEVDGLGATAAGEGGPWAPLGGSDGVVAVGRTYLKTGALGRPHPLEGGGHVTGGDRLPRHPADSWTRSPACFPAPLA